MGAKILFVLGLSALKAAPAPPPPFDELHATPLCFEPGGRRAPFLTRGKGFTAFFETSRATIETESGSFEMIFRGASRNAFLMAEEGQRVGILSSDEEALQSAASVQYAQLRYVGLYPGIDLVFHGRRNALEYDFHVQPGADPGRIEIWFGGAASMAVQPDGAIALTGARRLRSSEGGGALYHHRPFLYQVKGGVRVEVTGRYVPTGPDCVRFAIGPYSRTLPLVIDPVVEWRPRGE